MGSCGMNYWHYVYFWTQFILVQTRGPLTRTEALNLISSYKDLISRHSSLLKRSHYLAKKPDDSLAELVDGMDEAGPRRGTFWSKRSTEPSNGGGSNPGSTEDLNPSARPFLHFSSIIRPKSKRSTLFSSIIRPKSKRQLFSSIVRSVRSLEKSKPGGYQFPY